MSARAQSLATDCYRYLVVVVQQMEPIVTSLGRSWSCANTEVPSRLRNVGPIIYFCGGRRTPIFLAHFSLTLLSLFHFYFISFTSYLFRLKLALFLLPSTFKLFFFTCFYHPSNLFLTLFVFSGCLSQIILTSYLSPGIHLFFFLSFFQTSPAVLAECRGYYFIWTISYSVSNLELFVE